MQTARIFPFEGSPEGFRLVILQELLSKVIYLHLEAVFRGVVPLTTNFTNNINKLIIPLKHQSFPDRIEALVILLLLNQRLLPVLEFEFVDHAVLYRH